MEFRTRFITLLLALAFAGGARAQTIATWTGATSGDWHDGTNWSSTPINTAPSTSGDQATFGTAATTAVSVSADTSPDSITFQSGADAFTFTITDQLNLGLGIINSSSNTQTFNVTGSGSRLGIGDGSLANVVATASSGGQVIFFNNGSAGSGSITAGAGGTINFYDGSNAGTATITADTGGYVFLQSDGVTAGSANFVANAGGTVDVSLYGNALGSIAGAGTFNFGSHAVSAGGNDASTEVSGIIADGGSGGGTGASLVKDGNGVLTLSGENTYTGGTVINNGVLIIGNGGTTGSVLGDITDNASLVFNRSDDVEFSGVISGNGALQQAGAGTLTLSGANTYTGTTDILDGTLKLGNTDALSGSTLNYLTTNTGTLDFGTLTAANLGGLAGDKDLALTNGSSASVDLTIGGNEVFNTYSGNLSGGGSLTKVGYGTQVLSGANTYTGGTTIQQGYLQFANPDSLAAGGLTVWGNAEAVFNVGGAGEFTSTGISSILASGTFQNGAYLGLDTTNGPFTYGLPITDTINGSLGLEKLGSGTLTLTGNNTYTADTYITAGTLVLTSGGSLYDHGHSAANIYVGDGTTLVLADNNVFDVHDITPAVAITVGAGGLVTNGGNYFNTLNNLTLNGGELRAEGGAANIFPAWQLKGTVTVGGSAASTITATGPDPLLTAIQIGDNTVGGITTFNVADVTNSLAPDLTISNALQDGHDTNAGNPSNPVASGLVKTGGGLMLLTGANTYTGGTTIQEGYLQFGGFAALPASGTLTVWSNAEAVFNVGGSGEFTSTDIAPLLAGGGFQDGAYLGLDTTNGNYTYGVALANSGGGSLGLEKLGGGTLTLGTANTFTGDTYVTAGTLELGDSLALQNSTLQYWADYGEGTLSFGSLTAATLGGLNGSRNLALTNTSDAGVALTIGGNNASNTYSGNLSGAGASLIKVGTGTQFLSGTNTYDGGTTVSDGTLWFRNASSLPTSGNLSVGTGATAAFNVGGDGEFGSGDLDAIFTHASFSTGSFVAFDPTNIPFVNEDFFSFQPPFNYDASHLTGGVGVVMLGQGTVELAGSIAYTGDTVVRSGTLAIVGQVDETLHTNTITVGLESGDNSGFSVYSGGVARATDIVLGAVAGSRGRIDISSNGTLHATNLYVGAGGTGTLGLNGPVTTDSAVIGRDAGSHGSVAVNGSSAIWTNTGAITIGDAGTGQLELAHSTNVISGSVVLGANVGGAGTLNFRRDVASPAGTLTTGQILRGDGTATLNIDLGTLQASGDQADFLSGFSAGDVQILSGGATIDSNGYNIGISAVLQGAGLLTKIGTGTLTLSGANTHSGGTTVNAGTLVLADADAAGTGTLTAAGGILDLGGFSRSTSLVVDGGAVTNGTLTNATTIDARSGTISALITGSTGLTKTTAGTLTLSAANTFSGATSVSAGTLALGDSNALQNSTVSLDGGAIGFGSLASATFGGLAGSGNLNVANTALTVGGNNADTTYSGNLGALAGSLTKAGTGTLTLSGSNNSGIGLTVSQGTVQFGSAGALTGTLSAASGTTLAFGVAASGAFTDSQITSLLAGSGVSLSSGVSFGLTPTGGDYTFGTAIIDPASGSLHLVKLGADKLTLTAANTYTGGTTVSAGTLEVATGGSISHASANLDVSSGNSPNFTVTGGTVTVAASRIGSFGTGTASVSAGTWNTASAVVGQYGGTGTLTLSGGTMVIGGGTGTLVLADQGAEGATSGTLTIEGDNTTGGGQLHAAEVHGAGGTAVVNFHEAVDSPGFYTFTANLTGNLSVNQDAGRATILTGTNTYTGGTTVYSFGALTAGRAGALPNNTAYVINGGNLDTGGYGLTMSSLSGTGGEVFMRGGTLTVNQSVNTEYAGVFDNVGQLTKTGAGTLTLSAANTYTGSTTISGGTLRLGHDGALGASDIILSGGTLDLNGHSQTGQFLTVTGNSFIDFGGVSSLVFADSSGLTWSGTLTILDFGAGDSFRVGTGTTGLTSAQLSLIDINGFSAAIDGSGFLAASTTVFGTPAVPEPSTYAILAGLVVLGLAAGRRRFAAFRLKS